VKARVLASIREVPAREWDALVGDDPVFRHAWFRTLESADLDLGEPRHIVIEDAGRLRAVVPCFLQHADPFATLPERLFGPWAARIFGRALVAYSPLAQRSGCFLDATVEPETALALIADQMHALCTEERVELAGWPFVGSSPWLRAETPDPTLAEATRTQSRASESARYPSEQSESKRPDSLRSESERWESQGSEASRSRRSASEHRLTEPRITELRRLGFHTGFLAPTAHWHNEGYANFDAYLTALKRRGSRRYRAVRNELNRFAKSDIELIDAPLDALSEAELASMHRAHQRRHAGDSRSAHPERFFAALRAELADSARLHLACKEKRPLAYSIVLTSGKRWHMFLCGELDTEQAHAEKLHFNLNYYFPMRLAIEAGVPLLDYGLSTYQAKLQRGCELEAIHFAVRARRAIVRGGLGAWTAALDRWYRYKHRSFGEF